MQCDFAHLSLIGHGYIALGTPKAERCPEADAGGFETAELPEYMYVEARPGSLIWRHVRPRQFRYAQV